MTIFDGFIEKGAEMALKRFLQKYVEDYGTISEISVDLKVKEVCCSLDLKGEKELLTVTVGGVKVAKEEEKYYVSFHSIEVSRMWLDLLLRKYLPEMMKEKRAEVPELAGKVLVALNIFS